MGPFGKKCHLIPVVVWTVVIICSIVFAPFISYNCVSVLLFQTKKYTNDENIGVYEKSKIFVIVDEKLWFHCDIHF